MTEQAVRAAIRDVPDYPKPGIVFKDVSPIFLDPAVLRSAMDALEERWKGEGLDAIAAIESRGFLVGAPLADRLGVPLVLVRKAGKLPRETRSVKYDLEYGTDTVEMHADALSPGARVLVVDDLLATGGTARATAQLVEEVGGQVAGFAFLVHLAFLDGKKRLGPHPVQFLVEYD